MRFEFYIVSNIGALSVFEDYESVIWTTKLNEPGECEITAPLTDANIRDLTVNAFIVNMNAARVQLADEALPDREARALEACLITSVEIDEDARKVTAKGIGIEYLMSYRVSASVYQMPSSWKAADWSQQASEIFADFKLQYGSIPRLRDGLLKDYQDASLAIHPRTLSADPTDSFEASWNGYLELMQKMAAANPAYHFKCFWVFSTLVAFELLTCRTATATFSDDLENLSGFKKTVDISDFCDGALVLGEGEGADRKKTWYPGLQKGAQGYHHRFIAVDARDMQRADYASDDAYMTALYDRGREKTVSSVVTYEFDIDATSQFRYREDFYIGDDVRIIHSRYGADLTAQVAQAVESYSADGYAVNISVGNIRENLATRLKKRYGR